MPEQESPYTRVAVGNLPSFRGPAIIDALAPLGAKMPEGEPVGIRVGWKINITLGSNGVRREENEYTLFTPGAENPWVKLYENCL